ncbi:MAG: SGNH/GDSL hydrolase family protein [Candidatus Omnitrophota bacterium]|jgi:lysophospholipase L1-like esterase
MKKLIKSIVFVLVYSFILLELGLFVSGKLLLWQRREKMRKQANTQFVCIGDSHTFGVGTSAPYAYPKQLEKLMNSNNPGKKFSVINLGVPGSSTGAQSIVLQSFFENHKADIVLWLTGRNNTDDIKLWKDRTLIRQITSFLNDLKSVKFFMLAFGRFSKENTLPKTHKPFGASQPYADLYAKYLGFYLETVRRLCEANGAKLILLSYYDSTDPVVKEFANKHHIPFFDFTDAFLSFFRDTIEKDFTLSALMKKREAARHISPDNSHMNRLGYKFYSECLYENIFLSQKYLDLRLNPLLQKVKDADFYSDRLEIEKCVRSQQERVEQSKGTWHYAFEQIQLGHIYSEIGRDESAKQCFMEGLVSSNYDDNNMLVSPIITWHLKRGRNKEALQLCDDIIFHNPENSIAKTYQEMLSADPA